MIRFGRFAIAVAAMALSAAAYAQTGTPSPAAGPALPREIENRFKAADLTRRGSINKTEAASAGFQVEESFDVIDDDKDDLITLYEISTYLGKRTADWASADKDQDGTVSRSEAQQSPSLVKIFTRADRNGDGVLRKEEHEAFSQTSLYQNVDLPYVVPNIINKKF